MGGAAGFVLECGLHDLGDPRPVVVRFSTTARSRVPNLADALFGDTMAPEQNRASLDLQDARNAQRRFALAGQQGNPTPKSHLLRSGTSDGPLFESQKFGGIQSQTWRFVGHAPTLRRQTSV